MSLLHPRHVLTSSSPCCTGMRRQPAPSVPEQAARLRRLHYPPERLQHCTAGQALLIKPTLAFSEEPDLYSSNQMSKMFSESPVLLNCRGLAPCTRWQDQLCRTGDPVSLGYSVWPLLHSAMPVSQHRLGLQAKGFFQMEKGGHSYP